ncbi:torsin-1A-like [Betta splendens]|uniref:Torsin n=1 Tax=Betta splendens TaxID=158456 RepID=A0A6P7P0J4_BETSP|nr:torsin-1A-like [Betta splendens]
MKARHIYLLLYLFVTTSVDSFNLFSYVYERCDSNWISFNAKGLQNDLDTRLFGQEIAALLIMKAVSRFMANDNPKKPLVLSLHGPSGTGKNFVTELIAKNIYKKGMESDFVNLFVASNHFTHSNKMETYKSQLKQWIHGNVTQCERSMFIFDNMDKMHPGLIDAIVPFLNYYNKIDGVSFRKVIFIFISNAGAQIITQTALELWKNGQDRTEIKLKDVEKYISESVFNNNSSGFWHSRLIEENLVDYFVPFLPLEYEHVVQCLMALMKANGLPQKRNVARRIARDQIYFPKFERVFSLKGCKGLHNRFCDDV